MSYLYWKDPAVDTIIEIDFTAQLNAGETVTAVTVGPVSPSTNPALVVTMQDNTHYLLQGGASGLSYGFSLQVTTNARTFFVQAALTAQSQADFVPYTASNPAGYQTLVDELAVGTAAQATAFFTFAPQVDPKGGFVTWELLAQDGTVYAAGNAFTYEIKNNGVSNRVKAQAVVTCPSNMPPTLLGQSYQIRWTLQLPIAIGTQPDVLAGGQGTAEQQTFYQFENVKVVGLNTTPLGVQPSVEIQGGPAHMQLGLDRLYDNVTIELWDQNQNRIVGPVTISEYERTYDGFVFSAVLDTNSLKISLLPYSVVWRYWSSAQASMQYQETTQLWVTNPSVMTAVSDVRSFVQKAGTSLYGTPDLIYTNPTLMLWLRRGMDYFNGAYGQFTSFTMTNAKGPIREYWLMCAEKFALEAQYGAEGEKAFNFQGQAISLDVDRTQYLDNMIGKLQSTLDNELKSLKQNLIIKGNTSGDGSADPSTLQQGAIGAVGIALTAASMWGRNYSYGSNGLG